MGKCQAAACTDKPADGVCDNADDKCCGGQTCQTDPSDNTKFKCQAPAACTDKPADGVCDNAEDKLARLILLTTPSSSVKQQHALTSQLMECVTMQMTNAVEDKLARLILLTTPSSSVSDTVDNKTNGTAHNYSDLYIFT